MAGRAVSATPTAIQMMDASARAEGHVVLRAPKIVSYLIVVGPR
jgi:hypothetical protein